MSNNWMFAYAVFFYPKLLPLAALKFRSLREYGHPERNGLLLFGPERVAPTQPILGERIRCGICKEFTLPRFVAFVWALSGSGPAAAPRSRRRSPDDRGRGVRRQFGRARPSRRGVDRVRIGMNSLGLPSLGRNRALGARASVDLPPSPFVIWGCCWMMVAAGPTGSGSLSSKRRSRRAGQARHRPAGGVVHARPSSSEPGRRRGPLRLQRAHGPAPRRRSRSAILRCRR